jgi:RimJ/RimL family protein N-acetyltransferase
MRIGAGPVSLRELRPEDHEPVIGILSDEQIMKWALDDRPFTRAEAEFLRTKFANGEDPLGMRVVVCDTIEAAIGFSGLRNCELLGEPDIEFGWVLAKTHHSRGYATLLGHALIAFALNVLKRPRVLAACHAANAASEHVLRDKLRMHFVQEVEPRPNVRRRVYSTPHRDADC